MSARTVRAIVAGILLAIVPCASAQGSDETQTSFTVTHSVGWKGLLVSDALNPVSVTLTGGERSESGLVRVEVGRNRGVISRTLAPFVTTPQKRTRVELAVSIPQSSDYYGGFEGYWVRIVVTDERRRVHTDVRYSNGLEDRDITLQHGFVSREFPFVLIVDDRDSRLSGPDLSVRTVESGFLPRSLDAYDGVDAIVLRGEAVDGLTPAVVDAITEWVERGGRLLLVPGSATTSLAPWGIGSELSWVEREGEAWFEARNGADWSDAPVTVDFEQAAAQQEIAGQTFGGFDLRSRNVVITEPEPVKESAGAPIAPVTARAVRKARGLGLLTVIAQEPSAESLNTIRRQLLWLEIVRAMSLPTHGLDSEYPWMAASMTSQIGFAAIDRATRQMERVEPFPYWMFAVMVGALCLLVGPVDALVLKRLRLRHRSWQLVLVWIGLASAVAWWLPGVIRPSEAQVARFLVLDAFAGADTALRTGVTSVFSSGAISVGFTDADTDARWRTMPFADRAMSTGFGIEAPVTHIEGRPRVPDDVRLANWSLRALIDEGTSPMPFTATARLGEDGTLELFVEGIDASEASCVIVRARGGYRAARAVEASGGTIIEIEPDSEINSRLIQSGMNVYGQIVYGEADDPQRLLCTLIGEAHRRTGVIEMLTDEGGGHVMIGFVADADSTGVTVEGIESPVKERAFVRLLVPIENAEQSDEEATR